jgi:hypothetical protein
MWSARDDGNRVGVWRTTGAQIAEFYLSPAAAAQRGGA